MAADLNSIFRKYLTNLGKNEEAVVELTRNLRNWAVQTGEVVKERIETQIDESAVKMGFAKSSELEILNSRIADLEKRIADGSKKVSKKKSSEKSTSKKKPAAPRRRATK